MLIPSLSLPHYPSLHYHYLTAIAANKDESRSQLSGSQLSGGSVVRESVVRGVSCPGVSCPGVSCPGGQLSGSQLSGESVVRESVVRESVVRGVSCPGVSCPGSQLSGSQLSGESVVRESVVRESVVRSQLSGSQLSRSQLSGYPPDRHRNAIFEAGHPSPNVIFPTVIDPSFHHLITKSWLNIWYHARTQPNLAQGKGKRSVLTGGRKAFETTPIEVRTESAQMQGEHTTAHRRKAGWLKKRTMLLRRVFRSSTAVRARPTETTFPVRRPRLVNIRMRM